MLTIENNGPDIASTNYWGSEFEKAGKLFCSVNAGSIRILVPRSLQAMTEDCRRAEYAILSRGPWPDRGLLDAVEIMWEDYSDSPYSIHVDLQSFDFLPPKLACGPKWKVALWIWERNKPAKATEHKCWTRQVPVLPWLQSWPFPKEGQHRLHR